MNNSETRNPKSEGMTKSETRRVRPSLLRPSGVGFLSEFEFWISFGLRHPEFGFCPVTTVHACASNTLAVL